MYVCTLSDHLACTHAHLHACTHWSMCHAQSPCIYSNLLSHQKCNLVLADNILKIDYILKVLRHYKNDSEKTQHFDGKCALPQYWTTEWRRVHSTCWCTRLHSVVQYRGCAQMENCYQDTKFFCEHLTPFSEQVSSEIQCMHISLQLCYFAVFTCVRDLTVVEGQFPRQNEIPWIWTHSHILTFFSKLLCLSSFGLILQNFEPSIL